MYIYVEKSHWFSTVSTARDDPAKKPVENYDFHPQLINIISTGFPQVFPQPVENYSIRLPSMELTAFLTDSSVSRRDFILSTECIIVV